MRNLFLVFAFLPLLATADAIEWQSLEAVQSAATAFVQERTANIDGDVSINAVAPDKRVKVPSCDHLQTSLPSGNRLWGRTSVKVSCSSPRWALYVPVTIKVTGKALVATRSIGSGQVIADQDVEVQVLDLTPYPIGVFTRPEQAIGKTTASNIAAGNPLRAEVLRAQLAVRQGQHVVVMAKGGNFKVTSEGIAMNNAAVGQIVGVKTTSGQMVKGIATDSGMVEINF
ncbi:MAG TPA: flagellar basal body P-ring formation chaperone FlgA [Methylophilaceae bacterium]|jgi:flagella basal body P-ring formation protein FlgA